MVQEMKVDIKVAQNNGNDTWYESASNQFFIIRDLRKRLICSTGTPRRLA